MNNQAAQTMPELRELARRAVPFLRDEGSNYEDDGNNEPLELARAIEAALAGNPNRDAANPGGCECEKCGRVFIGAEWHVLCGICIDHGVAQPDGSGLRNGDNVSASTPEASPQPQVTNPTYTACNVEGTWLWGKLMDWCRAHRTSPASFDSLFAIAREAHQANQQAGQNRLINNDLDGKSTSEQAALSQTAGVADGFVIAPREPTPAMVAAWRSSIPDDSCSYHADDETWAAWCSESWNAMLAAAPAASGVDTSTNEAWAARAKEKIAAMDVASGGGDDLCPNCVTPWKCNGPHESTGGASVSVAKRLRDAIEGECDGLGITEESAESILRYIGFHPQGRIVGGREIDGVWVIEATSHSELMPNQQLVRYDDYRAALEQALTQQRGAAAAHASGVPGRVTDALVSTVEAAMHACYMDHDDYRLTTTLLHDMAVAAVKAVGTTTQPSADAVRELVNRWRISASAFGETEYSDGARDAFSQCARELESLLSGGSNA